MDWMFSYQEIHQTNTQQKQAQEEKNVCHGWEWVRRILV